MSKNRKSDQDESLVPGTIVRIALENFLTYHNVEFRPGNNLNLIIGPNGNGKSSIICAICLGLAGKPVTLGRATSIAEFILHGKSRAVIEIELYNNGGNILIMREIIKPSTTHWKLNGKQCTQKMVEDTVSHLNIQIDNLCQFLPQDRVADFVKMSSQELLENTEKLAGPENMWMHHQNLKSNFSRTKELETAYSREKEALDSELQKVTRLEEQVKAFTLREEQREKLNNLKTKRAWMTYEERRNLYSEEKKVLEELEKTLKQNEDQINPQKQLLKQAENLLKELESKNVKLNNSLKEINLQFSQVVNDLDDQSNKMIEVKSELQGKIKVEEERISRLNALKQQLQVLQLELQSAEIDNSIQVKIDEVGAQIQKCSVDSSQILNQIESKTHQKRYLCQELEQTEQELKGIQDFRQQRLQILRERNRNAYQAYEWVQKNLDKFKKEIHGPVMTCVNVKSPNWSKYIEWHISFNDMIAFVCEDPSDMEYFMSSVRDEMKIPINVILMPSKPSDSYQPQISLDTLKPYGFNHFLKDMIEAPEAVLRYLCMQYRIYEIPVGNRYTKDNVQQVLDRTGLRTFYTENHLYSVTVSRYAGNKKSTRCSEVKAKGFLAGQDPAARIAELQNQLKSSSDAIRQVNEEVAKMRKNEDLLKEKCEQLRTMKKELLVKRDTKKNLMAKINQKTSSVQRCENERIDLEAERRSMNRKLKKLVDSKEGNLKKLENIGKKYCKLNLQGISNGFKHDAQLILKKKMEVVYHECVNALQSLKIQVTDQKAKCTQALAEAKKFLSEAQKLTGQSDLSDKLKKEFQTMPNTISEIQEIILNIQAQLDCTSQIDASVIQDYNMQKKKIDNLTASTDKLNSELENYLESIEVAKTNWLPHLQELIERINENFGNFFGSMGCAGEVSLYTSENKSDYDKYGICIKVKFRDSEPLQELSSHQSGGERSVATVLYLMALQELVKVPFRCVDEINQGMDSTNERRIFHLVTQTVCKSNTSQYFLVTPKLLPDLDYSGQVTVLLVNKGQHLITNNSWSIDNFIKIRSQLQ